MKPSDFPDAEAPTVSTSPAARAAKLVSDWRRCTLLQQKTIERMAHRLARLPKVKKK